MVTQARKAERQSRALNRMYARKMRLSATLVGLLLMATSAQAGEPARENIVTLTLHPDTPDALMPDASGFAGNKRALDADYAAVVATAIPEAFAPDVRVRAVMEIPMPGSELIVGLKENEGHFTIFGARSKRWLWQYSADGRAQATEFREKLEPNDVRKVRIERCSVPIDQKTGEAIMRGWSQMLRSVKSNWVAPPVDDAWTHFSALDNGHIMTAQTWTSYGTPKVTSLISLAAVMHDYCTTKKQSRLRDLRTEVRDLLAVLDAKPK